MYADRNLDDLPISDDVPGRSERVRQIRRQAEDETTRLMQELHDTGGLRHLYGKPLELDDDPNWLTNRVLKEQGFSHPLIETRRDLDAPRQAAEAVLERLRRHRRRLTGPQVRPTPFQIHDFNEALRTGLEEYRAKLVALNTAVRDYNLTVPEVLHVRPVFLDSALERARAEILPLEFTPVQPPPRRSFRLRLPWSMRRT